MKKPKRRKSQFKKAGPKKAGKTVLPVRGRSSARVAAFEAMRASADCSSRLRLSGLANALGNARVGNARLFAVVMAPVVALVFALSGLISLKDKAAISRLDLDVAHSAEPQREAIRAARVEPHAIGSVPAWLISAVPPSEVDHSRTMPEVSAADAGTDLMHLPLVAISETPMTFATPSTPPRLLAKVLPESVIVREAGAAATYARLTISDAARGLVPAREARSCFAEREGYVPGASAAGEKRADFGRRLARVALRQTREFVFYTDRYFPISYPGGDIPSFYGVCSDVVVRAFRELGIDLQVLVHEAGVGIGDRSIDHRRVSVLKRFFTKAAQSLEVSSEGGAYLPGDIVTYFRPRNTGTRTHIAIVSDVTGPSGNPMIIHNRGNGVQLEDALFGDPITGHFRYGGRDKNDEQLAEAARAGRSQVTALTLGNQAAR